MSDLNSICLVCLHPNISLETAINSDTQNANTVTEVKYVLPELAILDYEIPIYISKHICFSCRATVHSFYTFKNRCLEIYSRLIRNSKVLQDNSSTQNQSISELEIRTVDSEPVIKQEQEVDFEFRNVKEETEDSLMLLEEKDEQTTVVENNIVVKEEYIISDESVDFNVLEDVDSLSANSELSEILVDNRIPTTYTTERHPVEDGSPNAGSLQLPEKSRSKYERSYERYTKWCEEKNVKDDTNEKVLLAYFESMAKTYKSSSLWAFYSMLRAMISLKKNVDISKYNQLVTFLKRKSEGYRPKKSKVLTKDDIVKFIREADDHHYLLSKVAFIIGLAGACKKEELTNLLLENVKDEGQVIHIQIPNTRTTREFFVTSGGFEGINMVEIIRKYVKLRPQNTDHGRFFVGYKKGSCVKQPVGINSFGAIPKGIAAFLKLSNPKEYTGHCFRRSSTSLLAESGADRLTVKRHCGFISNTLAEGLFNTSVENKKKVAIKIFGEQKPSTLSGSSK